MDAVTKKICGLLDSPDNVKRCAAAIALGALKPKGADVVKVLGEALAEANQMLSGYILDTLETIGSKAAVPYVLPLLDSEDMATKLRAVSILSKAGGAIVAEVKHRLPDARRREKLLLADLLARIHTTAAFALLLDLLLEQDLDVVKEVCEAVHRHAGDASPAARAALHKQVTEFLKGQGKEPRERVLASCLLVLGHIGHSRARTVLLKYSAPDFSPYVRRHALLGLRCLDIAGAAVPSVQRQLVPYLEDGDEDVARLALEVLSRLPVSGSAAAQWVVLLSSRHGRVRAFAASRLAEAATPAARRRLLSLLSHDDMTVREVAARALARDETATGLLLDALLTATGADAAWQLAKILKPHAERLDKKALARLSAQTATALKDGHIASEAFLYVLRHADTAESDAVLLDAAAKFRRAKQWERAVDCLRRLLHSDVFDDECGYALSVCNLKLSQKVLDPHVRTDDHALRGLQVLLRNRSFTLIDRLTKDKTLDASDLFYVGFHFAESLGDMQEFGRELLQHVAKTWPRTKDGKAAKSKLKLFA
jgi:HEAT repeat protein